MKAPTPWHVIRTKNGNPTLIGYARVSTREQNLDAQVARLKAAGCCRIYTEKISGAAGTRPGWEACLETLRAGDVLAVVRVDRLGRRLAELVRTLDELRELGVNVRALEEGLDTSAAGGRFAFTIVAALAEKVRSDIAANTKAGLAELKKRGRSLGRPSKLDAAKIAQVVHLRGQGFSVREVARATSLGHATVLRAVGLAVREDPRQLKLGSS